MKKHQPKIPESEFQRAILAAFDGDENIKMYRRNIGGMTDKNKQFIKFGQAGQSDLWGFIKELRCPFCNRADYGVHFEIEVKSSNGKVSEEQKQWIEFVKKNNGIAFVLYPEPNDPIGLRNRILKMLTGLQCPQCVERSKL